MTNNLPDCLSTTFKSKKPIARLVAYLSEVVSNRSLELVVWLRWLHFSLICVSHSGFQLVFTFDFVQSFLTSMTDDMYSWCHFLLWRQRLALIIGPVSADASFTTVGMGIWPIILLLVIKPLNTRTVYLCWRCWYYWLLVFSPKGRKASELDWWRLC